MVILEIEHPVPDFERWKKTFDSDPLNRKDSGVRRYQIFRQTDNPDNVIVDLEFDDVIQAEAMLAALRTLWNTVAGDVVMAPRARIFQLIENGEY
jgi:hypothetical protein